MMIHVYPGMPDLGDGGTVHCWTSTASDEYRIFTVHVGTEATPVDICALYMQYELDTFGNVVRTWDRRRGLGFRWRDK